MKILLLSVNREKMPAPVFPLGLAYIAGAVRADGHEIKVIDLCFSKTVSEDLRPVLLQFQPDLIGISLRNLDNLTYPASVSYLKEVEEVIGICREHSTSKLAIGGSGYSLAPKELLDYFKVDFGIVGEGEEVFIRLIHSLDAGTSLVSIPGLLVRGEPFPSRVEGARVHSFQPPDRSLFETHRYLKEGGMGNIQTKRGCPFSCIYCTYPLLEGTNVRLRKTEEVADEIQHLTEEGVDYVYFVDDIFNYPTSFAEALCREIVRRKIDIKWSAFIHPGFIDETLLKWMKEAGCAGIEFGTDSGSPKMLANYKKTFARDDIIQSSNLCASLKINHCHYLLFGGPGEDEATLEESFQLMDQLDPTAVIVMLGVRIYPGTELEKISLSEGIIRPEDRLILPSFYISPLLGGRMLEIVREKALARRQWIVPGLEINITQNLMEGIRKFRIRGPLWELVGRMKRPREKPLGNSKTQA